MTKSLDLTGKYFGRWRIKSRAGTTKYREVLWNCECACGNQRVVKGASLIKGLSKSCGCLRYVEINSRVKVTLGDIYGRLSVIQYAGRDKHGALQWLCLCTCGKSKVILGRSLLSGHTRSCGCLITEISFPRIKDITGQRFGKLLALKRTGHNKYYDSLWECLCDCGVTIITRLQFLQSGHTTSCGCRHKEITRILLTKHGMSKTSAYLCWASRKRRDKENTHDSMWTLRMENALHNLFQSCVLCGSTEMLCVDHLLPLNLGYGLAVDNAVILCQSCNSSKGAKYITELAPEIRRKLLDASCNFQDYWESVSYQYD